MMAKYRGPPSPPPPYDLSPPPALVDFMMQSWDTRRTNTQSTIELAGAHAQRRRTLAKQFPGEYLVIPTGHEKIRANDTVYRFRPGSDFYYLTGNSEPDCVLVIVPTRRGAPRSVLFVEPNPGRTDPSFFTDKAKGELWVGPRLGVPESRLRYGVDEAQPIAELPRYLKNVRSFRLLRGISPKLDAHLLGHKAPRAIDIQLGQALAEMRLVKDEAEVAAIRKAIAATKRGFEDVIEAMQTARSEREIEGVFGLRSRVDGNDVGYGTIAASGAHACILHWTRNDGRLRSRDLLLLDAGVEGHHLYTADITRALPLSGTFSPTQREVYEWVLRAQTAALREVRPGRDFLAPHRAAMAVLAEGLCALGVLRVPADVALRPDRQLYKRYTLHNTSHMLGLDVHDCATARRSTYRYGLLRPGMVLTVEPGLYFQPDDQTVPPRLRGIGVRIEDDVLVTARGMLNLSASIPRSVNGIEHWMSHIWRTRPRRRTRATR